MGVKIFLKNHPQHNYVNIFSVVIQCPQCEDLSMVQKTRMTYTEVKIA